MSDLNRAARELLDRGCDADDPTEHEMRRNRRALALRLGAATVLGTASAAGPGSAAAAAGGMKITSLLVSAALGGAVAAAGISVTTWVSERAPAAVSTRAQASPPARIAAPVELHGTRDTPAAAEVAAVNRPADMATEVAAPSPRALPGQNVASRAFSVPAGTAPAAARRASPVAEPRPADTPADLAVPPAPAPSVRRGPDPELELVRAAEEDLHRGNPGRALDVLAEHERRFPHGMLWEEREVTRILALCQIGNVAAARAQAEQFILRAPASPFADRVREACAPPAAKAP